MNAGITSHPAEDEPSMESPVLSVLAILALALILAGSSLYASVAGMAHKAITSKTQQRPN
jgi:hypothetical protein